jgi:predicted regulator of Ras-like GTPase activity (Roadblock/LC7/MglB family)
MEENKNNDNNTSGTEDAQRSLELLLKELLNVVPGVKAAAIISVEGLPVISALPGDMDDGKVAATTSTLLSLAERAINEMNVGDLEQLSIQGSISNLIVMASGQKNVLTILTEKNVNLGLVYFECGRICEKISKIMK